MVGIVELGNGELVGSNDERKFGSVLVDCLGFGVNVKVKFAFDVNEDAFGAFG